MRTDLYLNRLSLLLNSFYLVSARGCRLVDAQGEPVLQSGEAPRFCRMIQADPDGRARCQGCHETAIQRERDKRRPYATFRCHAGLLETIVPIRQDGAPVVYAFVGQCLGGEAVARQWQVTRELLDWTIDPDDLRDAFYRLDQCDEETVCACARVMHACLEHALQEDTGVDDNTTDAKRLKRFINEHYAEPLTLSSIANALSMSRSKLCKIAATQGTTVLRLLAERRNEEAMRLLRNSRAPVVEIARRVGMQDNNYFAKQFKRHTGQSPRGYRACHGRNAR